MDLRVEHRPDTLGLTTARPRLSWRLPPGAAEQAAYRIRAGAWDSARVASDRSILVPYGGPALRTGQRVEWTVKVWTDLGESDWAAPARWEMGLLEPGDWTADWVAPPGTGGLGAADPYPVWLLRGSAVLDAPVERARLYVTAHGVYEFFVNGVRVGDGELTPGFTSYRSRLQVQTFDVTGLLRPGENALGAVLSGGWVTWRRWTRLHDDLGTGLLAQLHVEGADGVRRFGTGRDWTAAAGEIRTADLQQGQVVDFRAARPGWCDPGADPGGWAPVRVFAADPARLAASPAPPVRRTEELRPVAVTAPRPGVQVVDVGQNINGWLRLADLGPAGTTVTLTYGETLDAGGDVTTGNIRPGEPGPEADGLPWDFAAESGAAFQTDRVTSAGRAGDVFEPRHTTHGFRYVRVEGHPGRLSADDATGVAVHTDLRRTGWFDCDDERINRLHAAVVRSLRGNACDIPTDCPTRERAGWTGDWQVFVPTAAFLYDVAGFSAKWLRDLAAEQRPDGVVGHCAPESTGPEIQTALGMPPGSAGFGDAAVIVPWEIYQAYGDRDLLAEQWPSMTAWVDHAARTAAAHRHSRRVAARPVPAPHERFLWDTGFHWGEWNEPGGFADAAPGGGAASLLAALASADHGSVATAYLHHSAWLLARIAEVLGRDGDAVRYRLLAEAARSAWRAEFLRPDGAATPDTQATYVRALAFGLAPGPLRPRLAERLVAHIRDAGTHVGTGFLATPFLLPVLAATGHLDVAYDLLFQDSEPSWLTMIDRGATTIWEHWTGLDASGAPAAPPGAGSLNHYSKGAVASFLHGHVAGIRPCRNAPAYRRFRIAPRPGGGLRRARAVHDCPYGRIESSWRIARDTFTLDVTVPPGTSADVRLPSGHAVAAPPGRHRYACALPTARSAR
jgi:alpha-L-rhamnosidase